jgi:hypothetical protein
MLKAQAYLSPFIPQLKHVGFLGTHLYKPHVNSTEKRLLTSQISRKSFSLFYAHAIWLAL